ncbi:RNA polymerase sigma-70 factor [Streptomyces sp. NPDC020983]|uniref:RNA polymerase sigma-70 factor n=1 Tax=Streptomyces sp. NPDC020983 TaxID=3365106 RepID=UPI003798E2CC
MSEHTGDGTARDVTTPETAPGGRGAADRPGGRMDTATEPFVAHRNLLFTVAYEMLGSAADAEDVLQETWLRWIAVDPATVREPRAYLVRATTRQALVRLRTLSRRRETYVGPWLPEPLLTARDVAEDVEMADSVSMAMLLVLETLTPTERAVFVLREVFAVDYAEIAAAVDKSPAAVRQIAHRARTHVAARRPRAAQGAVPAAESRRALAAFRHAVETGDLRELLDMLAPDVVLVGDGGGVRTAATVPVSGAEAVGRTLSAGLPELGRRATLEWLHVNGAPALLVRVEGEGDDLVTVRVDDGLISAVYVVRNPEKLARIARETPVTRV